MGIILLKKQNSVFFKYVNDIKRQKREKALRIVCDYKETKYSMCPHIDLYKRKNKYLQNTYQVH